MSKKKAIYQATELNENDRRILDKYTKFYSNFIESNTADNQLFHEKTHEVKK